MIPLLPPQLWGRIVGNVSLLSLSAPALVFLPGCFIPAVYQDRGWCQPCSRSILGPSGTRQGRVSTATPSPSSSHACGHHWSQPLLYMGLFHFSFTSLCALARLRATVSILRLGKFPALEMSPASRELGLPCITDMSFMPLPFHVRAP